ncbi:MAG: TetR/AcrR family transcriptional regulator C-terminal domain-containing protein [Lachnospiraceae bacterium]|nr:TetR/AcrR family transcriptional regulator C-terminal domain-containing protein [Lachnospiraceae bacterium]
MEQKKNLTKKLIAESFEVLMEKHPFEKITIRMITDQAGLIRPTFYNHFQDKYDLVEWIFCENIIREVESLLDHGMVQEAIKFLFTGIHRNRQFYSKLLQVTGQNCLEEVMGRHFYELFRKSIEQRGIKKLPKNRVLNVDTLSRYYTLGLLTSIKAWLLIGDEDISVDELTEAYEFLLTHSVYDMIDDKPEL